MLEFFARDFKGMMMHNDIVERVKEFTEGASNIDDMVLFGMPPPEPILEQSCYNSITTAKSYVCNS